MASDSPGRTRPLTPFSIVDASVADDEGRVGAASTLVGASKSCWCVWSAGISLDVLFRAAGVWRHKRATSRWAQPVDSRHNIVNVMEFN
jgi:hypothetical protein